MVSDTSSREVQSVRTAFEIVYKLQELDGTTLNELADQLDLAKSTLHNYLGTLQSMGYVTVRDGKYRLGLRFLTHGMAARNGLNDRETIRQSLSAADKGFAQPIWWIVEEHGRGLFVEKTTTDSNHEIYGQIGKRSYLHTHAPGKTILASLCEDQRGRILEYHGLPRHTKKTTTDDEKLAAELDTIQDQGYAISDGEAALGVQSVGVAFEDRNNSVHAVGVFGYSHDFSQGKLEQDVLPVLRTVVEEIEASLSEE